MANGSKFLETRSWNTRIRGRTYIHAGQSRKDLLALLGCTGRQMLPSRDQLQLTDTVLRMEDALSIPAESWLTDLPFGSIIARGNLVETVDTSAALRKWPGQEPFGDFRAGRFAHLYQSLERIDPVPFKGLQGFFFADLPTPPDPPPFVLYS